MPRRTMFLRQHRPFRCGSHIGSVMPSTGVAVRHTRSSGEKPTHAVLPCPPTGAIVWHGANRLLNPCVSCLADVGTIGGPQDGAYRTHGDPDDVPLANSARGCSGRPRGRQLLRIPQHGGRIRGRCQSFSEPLRLSGRSVAPESRHRRAAGSNACGRRRAWTRAWKHAQAKCSLDTGSTGPMRFRIASHGAGSPCAAGLRKVGTKRSCRSAVGKAARG